MLFILQVSILSEQTGFLQFTSFKYIFYFLIDSLPLLFKSSNSSMPSVSFVFLLSTYNS